MASLKNLLNRLFTRNSPAPRIICKRGYDGAQTDRFNASWTVSNQPADAEIRAALEPLRNRARDLAVNNEIARKFLQMCVTNIVGPQGFILQALARDGSSADTIARNIIEESFWRWAARGTCETSGMQSFQDMQRLLVEAWKRDGEFLVRKVRGAAAGNEFGFALQVMEIDRLATHHSLPDTGRGTRIVMGIELALDSGRPVAYWLRLGEISAAAGSVSLTRIPADEIIHGFRPERPEQHRGVPPMHPVMSAIKMLAGYQESYIVACRTGASKMGFFVAPDGNAASLASGQDASTGDFYTDAAPGEFGVLPDGYQFQQFNPDYPGQNYDVFVKECLRSIASGLGVCYNGLANNLEGVNFSSIRAGVLEERDNWMVDQDWFAESFLRPVFADWIEMALTAGALRFPSGSALPHSKLPKFAEHKWQGRRWQWVDPLKDIDASITAIRAGLNSPQNIAAQMGMDLVDVIGDIAAANELARAAGLPSYSVEPPAPQAGAPKNDNEDDNAEQKALRAILLMRAAEPSAPASAPNITIHQAPITVHTPELRHDIHVPAQPAPEVRVDVAAPNVTIAPAEVEVQLEAHLPAQPAPVVNVTVATPDELKITAMPARETRTEVVRDLAGNIVTTTQTETDLEQP